jgi:hypothetical protein
MTQRTGVGAIRWKYLFSLEEDKCTTLKMVNSRLEKGYDERTQANGGIKV